MGHEGEIDKTDDDQRPDSLYPAILIFLAVFTPAGHPQIAEP
jgi:hypothetical protein